MNNSPILGRVCGCLILLATAIGRASAAAPPPQPYVAAASLCGGFPRAQIEMAAGFCAGIVLAPAPGGFRARRIKTPRMLLALDSDARHWLVSDLGGWTPGRGKIW